MKLLCYNVTWILGTKVLGVWTPSTPDYTPGSSSLVSIGTAFPTIFEHFLLVLAPTMMII